MAILVEEEKKPVNWIAILTVIIVLGSLFIGGYYLFFKNPELIDIAVPPELKDLQPLTEIKFDPKPVIDRLNKYYHQYAPALSLPVPGREDPFKPF